MRSRIIAVCLVAASVTVMALTGCTESQSSALPDRKTSADYPAHKTMGGLMSAADAVIVGELEANETRDVNVSLESDREENPVILPYEVARVRVDKVIKGDLAAGDIVEVKRLADAEERTPSLSRSGDRSIMFLEAYSDGIPYSLLNPSQGLLPVVDGQTKPVAGNGIFRGPESESAAIARLQALAK